MIAALYVEDAVRSLPRVQKIAQRFASLPVIRCERYTEVFNPRSQNFRAQKKRPSLILAHKFDGLVLPAPEGYGIGGRHNFYFSHMMNCLYDCRYCFLQGMYRSANYVLFVNYEDFLTTIDTQLDTFAGEPVWFFSGYDCDSLALEPVSGFIKQTLPFFAERPNAHLEIRTKSTQIRELLAVEAIPNAVVAFSFTPQALSRRLEHGVPSVDKRIAAMVRLQRHGWRIGLRFDPLIYETNYEALYRDMFIQIFGQVDCDALHSVSIGPFRMPRAYFKNILRLYPDEPLFAGPFENADGLVSYRQDLEDEMYDFCRNQICEYVPESALFAA